MLIAVHHAISSRLVFTLEDSSKRNELDALFVEIRLGTNRLLLAAAYIPSFILHQCYKDFINILEDVCVNYLPENVIACGDFNLPGIIWEDDLSVRAVQYVCPAILDSVTVIRQASLLMNWRQLFPLHMSKGYTLDLLFASSETYEYVSVHEGLVPGDPEHHDSAFFLNKGECQ